MTYRLLFAAVILAISPSAFPQYIPKFDVQGHRGARGLMPENSIPGFLLAIDSGVTTIELDVVITKDKHVVVSHEPWISTAICLDSSGSPLKPNQEKRINIYQLTHEQLKQFDCGSLGNKNFPQQKMVQMSKPLLSEVIAAVEYHIKSYAMYEVDYNIEIKSTADGDKKFHPPVAEFSDLVYNLLDEYIPLDRVVIQSFDFRVLKYWHKKYPHMRLAALVENTKSIDSNLLALGFKPSVYSPYYRLLSKEKVNYLHSQKIRVIPWTVNEVSEMLSLKGMGVDGFITDYPDRARKYKMTLNIQRP
jgi:glycerophosphoryl diester phosphodiesterase